MNFQFPVQIQGQVAVFILVLVRVGGLFAIAPFFTGAAIPRKIKVALVAGIGLAVSPVLAPQAETALAALSTPGTAIGTIVTELGIGVAAGFVVAIVVAAIQTAGHFIAQEMGMTVASAIDPLTSIQSTILSQMMSSFSIVLFIIMDFHHHLIRLITQSFQALPVGFMHAGMGSSTWASSIKFFVGERGKELFENAAQMAMPFTVTLLLVTVAMAFLARAVPEMNIFVLGFILRIVIGMGVFIVLLPVVADVFEDLFHEAVYQGASFVRSLTGEVR